MKQANQKYTILYGRINQEDKREGESNSIQNQRMMLEKYAADNGFEKSREKGKINKLVALSESV
ncbi:MAG: hypothetical protein NC238_01360 [Dehalobacter sp.]|nr:hypothetical protein [Dehalobacter sp.]